MSATESSKDRNVKYCMISERAVLMSFGSERKLRCESELSGGRE